jgi:hypothetical protein
MTLHDELKKIEKHNYCEHCGNDEPKVAKLLRVIEAVLKQRDSSNLNASRFIVGYHAEDQINRDNKELEEILRG